jgi:hypothetical protein
VTGDLFVNLDTGAQGAVWVEVLEPDAEIILPGFTREDAVACVANSVAHVVTWIDKATGEEYSASRLQGKPVRLRLTMVGAKLFSFGFAEAMNSSSRPIKDTVSDANVPSKTDDENHAREPEPDVIWNTPSANVSGSMPLGNGRLGASVYSTRADEVQLLISHTDSVDETGNLAKIGRLVIQVVGGDGSGAYRAAYHLANMTICLQLGRIHAQIWVDAHLPVVRVATSGPAHALEVSVHMWKRLGPVQDVVLNATDSLAWYHNNSAVGKPYAWESLLS